MIFKMKKQIQYRMMFSKQVKLLVMALFFLPILSLLGQQSPYTLNKNLHWTVDKKVNDSMSTRYHSFVKPLLYSQLELKKDTGFTLPLVLSFGENVATPKKLSLRISPVLVAGVGFEASPNRPLNELGVGAALNLDVGTKLSLNVKALAGRGVFDIATDSLIQSVNVIAGRGFAYADGGDSLKSAYTYQNITGAISYSPNKIFNFQLGRDRHFWGDGYRSLFLSDVAAPYPYFKMTTNVWNLNYVSMLTALTDASSNLSALKSDRLRKYAVFHYLGWNATKRITLGVFESIVWQGNDSYRNRGFDPAYLNPLIFFRPVEYSLGSSDNVLLGLSGKLKLFKNLELYGQLLLDEFSLKELAKRNGWWGNKFSLQMGLKAFDLFEVEGCNFQWEINYVRPYTYAHGSVQQSYTHLNQSLAHPLGANFIESIALLNYSVNRFYIEGKLQVALFGIDSDSVSYGQDLLVSTFNRPYEYGHTMQQGTATKLLTLSAKASYVIDPVMNLMLDVGAAFRYKSNPFGKRQTPYVYIGLRTDLGNRYVDF